MFAVQAFRRVRRIHYCLINKLAPYKSARWVLTAGIALAYAETTECSDLVTYLIGFYLLMLTINYFIPRGVSNKELDPS